MSFKAFLKRCLMEYFIITTCVTGAMGILGLTLQPEAKFGYESFFSPLIFGLISLLPSLITYSPNELSLRQTLIRKVLYIVVLEATLVIFSIGAGVLHSFTEICFFVFTVFAIYLVVNLLSWQLHKKEAGEINRLLKSMQANNSQSESD